MSAPASRVRWTTERRFYFGITLAILGGVLLGFARTFALRPWFSDFARVHGAPEPFFYFHGAVYLAWFVLLAVQPLLIATGNISRHRRLGYFGAGLAALMFVLGTAGSLIAAQRPTGFIDTPLPPLQFLAVPLTMMAQFGVFVSLAIAGRARAQSHKRYMLLASISLLDAAVARWPIAIMTSAFPVPGFGMTDFFVDLYLAAMVVWDLASRGRMHPVTLWGGLVVVAMQPLRLMLGATQPWQDFAGWAVALLGT